MWLGVIALLVLLVTVLGIRRMLARGPARVTTGLMVTGVLIIVITIIGTLAVSCSPPSSGAGPDTPPPTGR